MYMFVAASCWRCALEILRQLARRGLCAGRRSGQHHGISWLEAEAAAGCVAARGLIARSMFHACWRSINICHVTLYHRRLGTLGRLLRENAALLLLGVGGGGGTVEGMRERSRKG